MQRGALQKFAPGERGWVVLMFTLPDMRLSAAAYGLCTRPPNPEDPESISLLMDNEDDVVSVFLMWSMSVFSIHVRVPSLICVLAIHKGGRPRGDISCSCC